MAWSVTESYYNFIRNNKLNADAEFCRNVIITALSSDFFAALPYKSREMLLLPL